jgi:hypothetical protein
VCDEIDVAGDIWTCHIEDSVLPGFRLRIPMLIVLDTLKHENSSLRRVAETWMRCNLRSYLRFVPLTTKIRQTRVDKAAQDSRPNLV